MDIFTEQAASYDECIERIKAKHGPHIHVLRQKKIRLGGFLGFFEREGIELNFMISRDTSRLVSGTTQPKQTDFDEERKKILRQAAQTSPELASRVAPHIAAITANPTNHSNPTDKQSLDAILKVVQKLEARLDDQNNMSDSSSEEHETIAHLEELLELNDFSSSTIKSLVQRAKKEFSLEELSDFDHVQDTIIEWIGHSIPFSENKSSAKPRIIVIVGPTGVGKTTTIAKLAAAYSLAATKGSRPLNVRVITLDNYRIGAKQQIEIYGSIMNIPVSVAESAQDLSELMALHQDADIILIDTIGKSPKDYSKIAEMRHVLDAAGTISDIHLAMSATTKTSDMREIMQQYETFGVTSVIITKFDETTHVGNIISVLQDKQKPVAYITTGQRVPQDFEQASALRFLTNLEGFRVNRTKIEKLFPLPENRFEWR
ncbi:MAG TPA: flagellar biosynthesis protein FlhF [Treponemataceae bacterium]|nr:flagellar biosynthesis protein FlhF [Treponemataceae bacterium]